MTVFSVFLIACFLQISWFLCLEAYRGTERNLRQVPRYDRHLSGYLPSCDRELV